MANVTLEQINKNLTELRKDIEQIKGYMKEEFELAEDVKRQIEESRKRPNSEFVGHDQIKKRFS